MNEKWQWFFKILSILIMIALLLSVFYFIKIEQDIKNNPVKGLTCEQLINETSNKRCYSYPLPQYAKIGGS